MQDISWNTERSFVYPHSAIAQVDDALTDEERAAIIDAVREFAQSRLAPNALDWDRRKHFPRDVLAEAGELGLGGIYVRDDVGGTGLRRTDAAAIFEQLAVGDPAIAAYISIHNMVAWMIDGYGTDAQRAQFLPNLLAGRALAGFGLTEPEAGSDAGSTRTTARLEGAEWVIDGAKQFITNSGTAITQFVTVTAVTGHRGDRKEISTIIVPAGTPGFVAEPAYDKVGWNASDTHPLSFSDARVPAENLLGGIEGRGFVQLMQQLPQERLIVGVAAAPGASEAPAALLPYAAETAAVPVTLTDNRQAERRLILAFLGLTLVMALSRTLLMQVLANGPITLITISTLCAAYAWPVVPVIAVIRRWSRWRFVATLLLWFVAAVALLSWRTNENVSFAQVFGWMLFDIGLPLVVVTALCLGSATRAVAPWLAPLFIALCWASQAGVDLLAALVEAESPIAFWLAGRIGAVTAIALFALVVALMVLFA